MAIKFQMLEHRIRVGKTVLRAFLGYKHLVAWFSSCLCDSIWMYICLAKIHCFDFSPGLHILEGMGACGMEG